MQITPISPECLAHSLENLRKSRPLVHCLTNEVVQEITANVLLAAGASPAMVVAAEEAPGFTAVASGLLVNVGTPTPDRLAVMHSCARSAREHGRPWVLDPVAAGGMPWRDEQIRSFLDDSPTVIRGNASEILALAGLGSGGKGVDSTDSSDAALEAARVLSEKTGAVVCVTGETDYAVKGDRAVSISGGSEMATLVVGTGCSLSALVAAFLAVTDDAVTGAISACALAKRAAQIARGRSRGPGSFHNEYLDALYQIQPADFLGEEA
ncbi:hydroxyethylthiazole kinase [Sutterella sp.]|uniref:hydroxyethylthiazole kinase n=1 Tax=Sutterella sp. TaxID=1981025 RepID=UPI0026E0E846|nr:hydroxyethylthiazole kinase [Sutterella sp.]MDO5532520.1 hydroxyethylthiazole kinase [Sutterella sp.]